MSKWIVAGLGSITLGTVFLTVGMYIDVGGMIWTVPVFVYLVFIGAFCFIQDV